MDLSKLPRLSESDKHAPATPASGQPMQFEQPARPVLDYGAAPGSGLSGQVWLSAILGLVFMMMGWTFARYMIATMSGKPFDTNVTWTAGPKAGQPVEYFELQGYTALSDAAIFFFGFATLLEAAVLAFARTNTALTRALVAFALLITVGMVALNVVVAGLLFNYGVMPLPSVLAVAFGGWMAMFEWNWLRQMLAQTSA